MGNVFAEFLQESGLYANISITQENVNDLYDLLEGKVRINSFCKECGGQRVFSMAPIVVVDKEQNKGLVLSQNLRRLNDMQKVLDTPRLEQAEEEKIWSWCTWKDKDKNKDYVHVIVFSFSCAMDESHKVDYVVCTEGNTLRKIGQYPSVADLTFPELSEYKKVASKEDLKELRRAIGLYAQGIGVGAYVYLRRVFERVIDAAKDMAVKDQKLNLEEYNKSKVTEKIKMLKDYLPPMMAETPVFYGIVSKGIHELSEEDCIAYFPIMKEFIFMILRQWEQKQKDRESEDKIKASISKIASTI